MAEITAEVDTRAVQDACEEYARALGKDLDRALRRKMADWCFKAQKAMKEQGFGRTSKPPDLPQTGRRSPGWKLVTYLWRARREAGLPVADTRTEFSRRERSARARSKGFLRWMTVAAASSARAALKGGNAEARSARGITAKARLAKHGGAEVTASVTSRFRFRIALTRAMKPLAVESANRRLKAAFDYAAPQVVAETREYVREQLAARAGKEGFGK